MAQYCGIVNGVDVMAIPGQPARSMVFIVDEDPEGVQVTAFEKEMQLHLEIASILGTRVTVTTSDDDKNTVLGIAPDIDLFELARAIAKYKGVEVEETPNRVRVLDR